MYNGTITCIRFILMIFEIFQRYGYKIFLGFTLSQATKALRESTGIGISYFRTLH